MKLATYLHQKSASYGVVTAQGICDIPAAWPDGPADLLQVLQAGPDALGRIAKLATSASTFLALEDVQLLAPIPNPPKLIGLAHNYDAHIRESKKAMGLEDHAAPQRTPRPFLMPPTAIAAPGQQIPYPCFSREVDYEIELAVVIGSTCKCVSPQQAECHIAGYTIANDVSARSTTFAENRSPQEWDKFYDWLHGKWADGFCPTGPWLVTADEIGDPSNLEMELTVNGETRQKANTGQMVFDVCEIVSFLSHLMTLTPGDVIATGTPAGVAMATGNYLAGGDVLVCRIERIGELTNPLGQPPNNVYTPCAGDNC